MRRISHSDYHRATPVHYEGIAMSIARIAVATWLTVLLAGPGGAAQPASATCRTLTDGLGVATALATKHQGWPDIEVGGPGFGKFPVRQWNGRAYVGS
jgi:hypothetical protein